MIQLTTVSTNGTKTSAKTPTKGTEKTTAFEELLQLLNGDREDELKGKDSPLAQLFQGIPNYQPPIQLPVQNVNEEPIHTQINDKLMSNESLKTGKKVPAEIIELLGDSQPKPSGIPIEVKITTDVQKSEIPIFQAIGKTDKNQPEKNKEQPNKETTLTNVQPAVLIPQDKTTAVIPTEKQPIEIPVRVEHLEKHITSFIKENLHVEQKSEGLEATFSLKPEHLGKVDVKVSIKEGNVTAEFFATTTNGKDILEANIHTLRTALEHQGFQVDKIDISQQQANFAGPFSQKGDSQQQRQGYQESKKRNGQVFYEDDDIRNISATDIEGVSQINTTA